MDRQQKKLECPSLNNAHHSRSISALFSFKSITNISVLCLCLFAPPGAAVWFWLWKCSLYPELCNYVYSHFDTNMLTTTIQARVCFESKRNARGHRNSVWWAGCSFDQLFTHTAMLTFCKEQQTKICTRYVCPFSNPAQSDMSQCALMYTSSERVCNQLTHFHCKDDLQHSPAYRRSCYSLNVYTSGCPLPLSSARGKRYCEILVCTVHAIVIDNPKQMNADMDSVRTNTVIALLNKGVRRGWALWTPIREWWQTGLYGTYRL